MLNVNLRKKQGITLIALVVTIVVLLILAAVSISMLTGENGIITQAQDAKEHTEIGNEKEIVNLAATGAMSKDTFGEIKKDNLKNELNQLIGEGKYELTGEGPFTVKYKDSGRSYIVETNGNIIDNEEYESKALKFLVNSGDDGVVVLPISRFDISNNTIINWGDETETTYDEIANKKMKLASKKVYIAASMPSGISHTYSEKNKEFIVTITGKCTVIYSGYSMVTKDKIIEVIQWGETGLEGIDLSKCANLRKIASPSKNSFINIEPENGLDRAFKNCTSLIEIPEDLFSNCPQVTSFQRTFSGCTNLTSIPQNLFSNCLNVEDFMWTFWGCSNLSGEAPKLWERVPNGSTNNYEGIPDGINCFAGAKGLSNYNEIPNYWKNAPE